MHGFLVVCFGSWDYKIFESKLPSRLHVHMIVIFILFCCVFGTAKRRSWKGKQLTHFVAAVAVPSSFFYANCLAAHTHRLIPISSHTHRHVEKHAESIQRIFY